MPIRVKFKSNHPEDRETYIFSSDTGEEYLLCIGEGSKVSNLNPDFMDKLYDVNAVIEYRVDDKARRIISRIISYK